MIKSYWGQVSLGIFVIIFTSICVDSYPLSRDKRDAEANAEPSNAWSTPFVITLGVVAVICTASVVAMCNCCHDLLFSPKGDAADTLPRRHSMEPPSDSSLCTPRSSHSELAVTIEPLPDIAGAKSGKTYTKPMGYNQVVNKGPDVSDWFKPDINAPDFPRGQLQYVKELGTGWFGSVVEGEASKMSPQKRKVKVVVQILREDLTSMERAYHLHTARMFRDVSHENVLKIIGKCVDKEPYLLLYEHCPQGDYLKSYLIARRGVSDDLVHSGTVLKMCCEVADGLVALHQKGFVHSDLACRNCLVSSNGTVKIGDYGTGFTVFKDEYVTVGDIAVPIRWISADSVDVAASGQLFTKEVTQVDNVWTLGVVVWEILEFGKLPYMELNNDGVVNMVLKNRSAYLPPPVCPVPNRERLYEVMRFCWLSSNSRPSADQISALLKHVYHFRPAIDSVDDFDAKWNSLVAAQRPAVLATVNGENSHARIANEPSNLHDSVPAIIEVNAPPIQSATEPAPNLASSPLEPMTTAPFLETQIEATKQMQPSTLLETDQIQDEPKMVPHMNEMDAERIEKRNFILTLSMADLAAMKTEDLVDFYEYLSGDEIRDLEDRHAMAVEEGREAEERRKKREEFLAMSLDEMEELKAEELEYYMRCLDELDRKETQEKLAAAAEEKRRKAQLEEKRNRALNLSDAEMLDLDEHRVKEIQAYLSAEEFMAFQERVGNLRETRERRMQAEAALNSDDRELAHMNEDTVLSHCGYLSTDRADGLKKKYDKLSNMKILIMSASDEELSNMTDGEFEHLANILNSDEADEVRRKRRQAIEKRMEAEKKRREAFSLTPVELAMIDASYLESLADVLGDSEMAELRQRKEEAAQARKYILSMDPELLRGVEKEDLENSYRYLTADEVDQLESLRTAPPVMTASSPSAQGSQLAEEALRAASEQLNLSEHSGGPFATGNRSLKETRQHSITIAPLSLASSDNVEYPAMPIATPEIRMEHHQQREKILAATSEQLAGLSQEEFEGYFQYLCPDEIFDIEERRKRYYNVASSPTRSEQAAPAENGDVTDTGDEFAGRGAWETRDYILHLTDNQLAQMKSDDLKQYSTYFTNEEFKQIERHWAESCEKLDFFKHSTDEELAVLPTERLEDCLSALPEEQRAQIRERVNAIQTRWLPATLRDEQAFRDILKTVPSISLTSESESYHHPEPAGQKPVLTPDTPEGSLDEELVIKVTQPMAEEEETGRVSRQFEDLFNSNPASPQKAGLPIPDVTFQAATPVDELSPNSEIEFPVSHCSPLNLEEDGLEDMEGQERTTSTPLYESFADSILKDIGDFGAVAKDLSSTYVTAVGDSSGESTTNSQRFEEHQNDTKQEVAEGDLLGDFGDFSSPAHNGDFHGDLFQASVDSPENVGPTDHVVKKDTASLLD